MNDSRNRLSIVVPLFNEEANLVELRDRLISLIDGDLGFNDYEVLLISDGSTDATDDLIAETVRRDERFKGFLLSRNFGHQAAVSVGLSHSRGSVVAVIDGDLQDPPEVIPELLQTLDAGADVAFGVRKKRKESFLKKSVYFGFYRLLRRVSSIDIPLDTGDFCCMKRNVVDAMLSLPERNRFVRGLRAWVGFRQVGVQYERAPRFGGRTKYSFRKLMGLAYDGLFAFSGLPVRLMQVLGFFVSSLSFLAAVGYLMWYSFSPERFPSGFATTIISIWFLGGVQLLFLGIVGEYVVRNTDEARGRPVALVRQILLPDARGSSTPGSC